MYTHRKFAVSERSGRQPHPRPQGRGPSLRASGAAQLPVRRVRKPVLKRDTFRPLPRRENFPRCESVTVG